MLRNFKISISLKLNQKYDNINQIKKGGDYYEKRLLDDLKEAMKEKNEIKKNAIQND